MGQSQSYELVFSHNLIKRVPNLTSDDLDAKFQKEGVAEMQRALVILFLEDVTFLDDRAEKRDETTRMALRGLKAVLSERKVCIHQASENHYHVVIKYGKGLIVPMKVFHPDSKLSQKRLAALFKYLPRCATLPPYRNLDLPINFD